MKRRGQFCDGAQRRDFLRVGSGSLFGAAVSLSGMLSGESHAAANASGVTKDDRSLIIVFLKGGLSTIDTFDMKPDAPAEFRGDFDPVASSSLIFGVVGMNSCLATNFLFVQGVRGLVLIDYLYGFIVYSLQKYLLGNCICIYDKAGKKERSHYIKSKV